MKISDAIKAVIDAGYINQAFSMAKAGAAAYAFAQSNDKRVRFVFADGSELVIDMNDL